MPTLDDKIARLYSRTGGYAIKFGLDTTRSLLAELGVDPLALPCVHIAGTNGKGSTAAMLASISRAVGLRTGLYTSPHIYRFNERIQLNGVPIPDDRLDQLIDLVVSADARQAASSPNSRPATFFELTTALAFKYFLDDHVHLAILETGMGGRLDATNVVDPILAIITPIGLEHTQYLGSTLAAIASEKAGIIKPTRPVLLAEPQLPEALEVLRQTASQRQSPVLAPEDFVSIRATTPRAKAFPGQMLAISTSDGDLAPVALPLLGTFQVNNAATAVTASLYLRQLGLPFSDEAIVQGLSSVRWPGRLQLIEPGNSTSPPTYLDVGHNPQAASALATTLRPMAKKRPIFLLCGLLSDKNALGFFRALRPVIKQAFLVSLPPPRGTPAEQLLPACQTAGIPSTIVPLDIALASARRAALEAGAILLVAGSFHLPQALHLELAQ